MRRAIDWIPLARPIEGRFESRAVAIVEIGFSGCRIEHHLALLPGAEGALRFEWRGTPIRIEAVVLQCELLLLGVDGIRYQTSLQFQKLTSSDRADLGKIVMGIGE